MHSITGQTVDPTIRLRIATRIHFALLRHYGEHVDVAGLLRGQADAREALWVCEASGHAELANLAKQFDEVTKADARRARSAARKPAAVSAATATAIRTAAKTTTSQTRHAPQDAVWAQDTSGFGVSRPPEIADTAARTAAPVGWLGAARWLRRAAGR